MFTLPILGKKSLAGLFTVCFECNRTPLTSTAIQNSGISPQLQRAEQEWEEEVGEKNEGFQALTRLYHVQHNLHKCMHLMQQEYTVPAWMIGSYL